MKKLLDKQGKKWYPILKRYGKCSHRSIYIGKQPKENKMTNEELYELMKEGFAQVNQRLDRVEQRLDTMDDRLRAVENDISERKGGQSAIEDMPDLLSITCAISALVISLAVAIFK